SRNIFIHFLIHTVLLIQTHSSIHQGLSRHPSQIIRATGITEPDTRIIAPNSYPARLMSTPPPDPRHDVMASTKATDPNSWGGDSLVKGHGGQDFWDNMIWCEDPLTDGLRAPDSQDHVDPSLKGVDENPKPNQGVTTPHKPMNWKDLNHQGRSVVLKESTQQFGSFQTACQALLLSREEIDRWLTKYIVERNRLARWQDILSRLSRQGVAAAVPEDDYGGDMVGVVLITRISIHRAQNFLEFMGFNDLADRIKIWAHTTVSWPLSIDVSTYKPDNLTNGLRLPSHIQDWSSHENVADGEEEQPGSKTGSCARLFTAMLPRGTIVLGPQGKNELEHSGEYMILYPSRDEAEDESVFTIICTDSDFIGAADVRDHQEATDGQNNAIHEDAAIFVKQSNGVQRSSLLSRTHSPNILASIADLIGEADPMDLSPDGPPEADARLSPFPSALNALKHQLPQLDIQIIPVLQCSRQAKESGPRPSNAPTHAQASEMAADYQRQAFTAHVDHAPSLNIRGYPRIDLNRLQDEINQLHSEKVTEEKREIIHFTAFPEVEPKTTRRERLDQEDQKNHATWNYAIIPKSVKKLVKGQGSVEPPGIAHTGVNDRVSGALPDEDCTGPVERVAGPGIVDDPQDLSFLTIRLSHGYSVRTPKGDIVNFNTQLGARSAMGPPSQGGVFSFFLPKAAELIPADLRSQLHDWVGMRFLLTDRMCVLRNGAFMPRRTDAGVHQIIEIDGEADLISTNGRYRLFNGMQAIGTPIEGDGDIIPPAIREAQSILRHYRKQLDREEEEEIIEEERRKAAERSAPKKVTMKLTKQSQRENRKALGAAAEAKRIAAREEERRLSASELRGRGRRERRPNSRYTDAVLGLVSYTDEDLVVHGDTSSSSEGEERMSADSRLGKSSSAANAERNIPPRRPPLLGRAISGLPEGQGLVQLAPRPPPQPHQQGPSASLDGGVIEPEVLIKRSRGRPKKNAVPHLTLQATPASARTSAPPATTATQPTAACIAAPLLPPATIYPLTTALTSIREPTRKPAPVSCSFPPLTTTSASAPDPASVVIQGYYGIQTLAPNSNPTTAAAAPATNQPAQNPSAAPHSITVPRSVLPLVGTAQQPAPMATLLLNASSAPTAGLSSPLVSGRTPGPAPAPVELPPPRRPLHPSHPSHPSLQ
ncbi:hypothetical protein BJ170DRAFT_718476, partial [Xylariales sp. AK1849]